MTLNLAGIKTDRAARQAVKDLGMNWPGPLCLLCTPPLRRVGLSCCASSRLRGSTLAGFHPLYLDLVVESGGEVGREATGGQREALSTGRLVPAKGRTVHLSTARCSRPRRWKLSARPA
jgi:hypothetical protein